VEKIIGEIELKRVVLTEKVPFKVFFFYPDEPVSHGREILVRQCVSEDELKPARKLNAEGDEPYHVSYNPSEYYVVLKTQGLKFSGNLVEKKLCQRIK